MTNYFSDRFFRIRSHFFNWRSFCLVGFFAFSSFQLSAEGRTEVEIFRQCYGQLTGLAILPNHPLMQRVLSAELSAEDACFRVLENASLQTSGPNEGVARGVTSPAFPGDLNADEAKATLKTFFDFFKSQFVSTQLSVAMNFEANRAVDETFSMFDPALHLARVFFDPRARFSDWVSGKREVREIRDEEFSGRFFDDDPDDGRPGSFISKYNSCDRLGENSFVPCNLRPASTSIFDWGFHHFFRRDLGSSTVSGALLDSAPSYDPVFPQVGELRGFRTYDESELQDELVFAFHANNSSSVGQFYTNTVLNSGWRDNVRIRYRLPYGAGFIGAPAYLMMTMGAGNTLQGFHFTNGGDRVWRRHSTRVFKDALCRDLPVIEVSDAVPYVRAENTLPWQGKTSCMSCHASIDGFAGATRNLSITSTFPYATVSSSHATAVHAHLEAVVQHPAVFIDSGSQAIRLRTNLRESGFQVPADLTETDLFSISNDPVFFRKQPKGRFIYRDTKGQFVDRQILGFEGSSSNSMGISEAILSTDDLYTCAASRMFKFMTGLEIPIVESESSPAEEKRALQFIQELGQQLKSHQSLKQTLRSIILSEIYREGL